LNFVEQWLVGNPAKRSQVTPRKEANVMFAIALLLGIGFVLLLQWFDRTDFYHAHFFDAGVIVRRYQVARTLFAFYLVWLVYSTGFLISSRFTASGNLEALPWWERVPLCFLTGAGVWHLLMFPLGLAGLVVKPVAVGLVCLAMLLSLPLLARSLGRIWVSIGEIRLATSLSGLVQTILVLAIIVAAVACFLVKGLYPAGGHDYFNHYSAFYRRVIETGSTQPNDVWYHFYYSKGCGLYFIAMLLTDPLAPQLVTAGFVGIGAVTIYALLRRSTDGRILPLIGVLIFVAFYIYTPGPIANMRHGGWGDFEKIHELTAMLILGVVWLTYRIYSGDGFPPAPWTIALHCTIGCIAVLTFALPILVGLYLTALAGWHAVRRRWWIVVHALSAAAAAGFWLLLMAAVNIFYTGFPLDQLVVPFWPHADLEPLLRWGAFFELLFFHRQSSANNYVPLPLSELAFVLGSYLRFELWWPIIVSSIPLLILRFAGSERRARLSERFDSNLWSCLLAFIGAVILVALFGGGLRQSISFYRLSTFAYGPMLCLALVLWHLAVGRRLKLSRSSIAISLFSCAMVVSLLVAIVGSNEAKALRANASIIVANAADLWNGQLSIAGAYRNQQGWPGRLPFGAIYPGLEPVLQIAGPRTRIWSFHIHSYCMLPECNVQGFQSFRFSPSWQTVLLGSPEDTEKALRAEGLDNFFFSSELGMQDILPLVPMFSPDQIDRHLGIRWSDGTSYLLSWRSAETTALTPAFLAQYRKSVSTNNASFDPGIWKRISDHIDRHKSDLHGFIVPWCTNCQGLSEGVPR
jgi:hypothetical protein